MMSIAIGVGIARTTFEAETSLLMSLRSSSLEEPLSEKTSGSKMCIPYRGMTRLKICVPSADDHTNRILGELTISVARSPGMHRMQIWPKSAPVSPASIWALPTPTLPRALYICPYLSEGTHRDDRFISPILSDFIPSLGG